MEQYDTHDGIFRGEPHVIDEKNEMEKVLIECECQSHLLSVISDKDIYINSDDSQQVNQSYYFSMYYHLEGDKLPLWKRLRYAWKFIWTGEVFDDQMVLSVEEIGKLSDFINKTKI